MRGTFAFLRLLLQNNFRLRNLKSLWQQKGERARLVVFLLVIPSFVGFFLAIYRFFLGLYQTLPPGQELVGLTVALLFASTLVLIFGIFYLLSVFFFAQDTEQLLPLPLRPSQIVGAKFAQVLVNEYLTLLPFLFPAFLAYVVTFPELFFWLRAVLVFFLVPILPLALAAIVGLVMMGSLNLPRDRDFWRVVGIVLSLGLVFVIQFFVFRSGNLDEAELARLLLAQEGLAGHLTRRYPPALWAAQFLGKGAIVPLLKLTLTALVCVYLLLLVGDKFFLRGAQGGEEVTKKRRRAVGAERVRSPLGALLWREFVLFVRNPVFLLNGVLNLVLPPVLFFFFFRGGLIQVPPVDFWILELVGIAYFTWLPCLSLLPSTAISREGKQFWLSRLIPAPPQLQLLAKLLAASLATALGGLLGLGLLRVAFGLPLLAFFRALLLGFTGSVAVGAITLYLDLLWPNLSWTDPQRAMKGNLSGLYGMLAGSIYLALVGFFLWQLARWGLGQVEILGGILLIFLFSGRLFWQLLAKRAEQVYWQEQ